MTRDEIVPTLEDVAAVLLVVVVGTFGLALAVVIRRKVLG